ncbi:Poly(rC)-binding protein 4 [Dissostichus eleginoides]|uniref:Poly(RC)-binding protein 4 n=1 Tax=Dissostichus eleginoides TaxID=100907 RepID=A0AAD9FDK7_DISEL|nr:Poly(rC)-binding protein 4 [Dissostichus eleginoides]
MGVTLTLRLLMHGKKGENQQCQINISEGLCPERIITISGPTESVFRAFSMITFKLEEDVLALVANGSVSSRPPVTLRLVIPASQCGSLIGKGGSKIKEIREVAGDLLPNSTEREVTISGNQDAIIQCVKLICTVILEVFEASDFSSHPLFSVSQGGVDMQQTYAVQSHYGIPHSELAKLHQLSMQQQSLAAITGVDSNSQTSSQELLIPNDLIGSIIGRQGSKINEIRQVSGAQIKIGSQIDGSIMMDHGTMTLCYDGPWYDDPLLRWPVGTMARCYDGPLVRWPVVTMARSYDGPCLETAKSTAQSSSMPSPVDLTMSFTQPSSSSSSSSSSSLPHAQMLGAPYALPLSSLLGMKSFPYLALSSSPGPMMPGSMMPGSMQQTAGPLQAALASYTAKIQSSANGMKKPERQKFAPY